MKDTLEIKLDLIRHNISTNNIKVTDLSQDAGYARPYVSSVLNNSRAANEGFLNHLLDTLQIDYVKEIENMQYLDNLMERFLHSLTYKKENTDKLYNQLLKIGNQSEVPVLLKSKYHECLSLYKVINKESIDVDAEGFNKSSDGLFILAIKEYNHKNFDKALEIIDSPAIQKSDTSMVLYFKSFCHFNNKNFIEAYHNLYKAEALILESSNYRRLFDLQILKIKLFAVQNKYNEASRVYENLYSIKDKDKNRINSLDNDWFACLILMKRFDEAYEILQQIQNLDKDNMLLKIYMSLKSKDNNTHIEVKNEYDKTFLDLINLHQKKQNPIIEIDKLYNFFYQSKHPNIFLELIINELLRELYKNNRAYKTVVEIQDKTKGLC